MNRRHFISTAVGFTGAALVSGAPLLHAAAPATRASGQKAPMAQQGVETRTIRNFNPAMHYRPMGTTGVDVSALGFGMLRLAMNADGKSVNQPLANQLLRHAIDNGLNYVDTAYVYLNGQSEVAVGKALRDGYRERVYLTSKSPWWIMERPEDFLRMFDESRTRLQSDTIDFYHIHFMCRKGLENTVIPFNLIEKIEKLKQDGKIRFSGFSFHDSTVVLKKVVDANPDWNFCLLQQNYLDTEHEAGLVGLKYAASRGLGVSVMEPLRNGFLVQPPAEVQAIFNAAPVQRSPVEWAFDYLWNMPEVSVVVSGMNSLQQVQDNMLYAGRSARCMFTPADAAVVGSAARRYRAYEGSVPCTGCYHCLPCPKNVAIGYILALVYNQYKANGNLERAKQLYSYMPAVLRGEKASACDNCGECVARCPQKIAIPEVLKKVQEELGA